MKTRICRRCGKVFLSGNRAKSARGRSLKPLCADCAKVVIENVKHIQEGGIGYNCKCGSFGVLQMNQENKPVIEAAKKRGEFVATLDQCQECQGRPQLSSVPSSPLA